MYGALRRLPRMSFFFSSSVSVDRSTPSFSCASYVGGEDSRVF